MLGRPSACLMLADDAYDPFNLSKYNVTEQEISVVLCIEGI